MNSGSTTRYPAAPQAVDGWRVDRITPPSRLYGANGLRTGADGRIYIAQVTGSTISALDVNTGDLETISAKGGDIIAPDDIAFGPDGTLYATEVMDGRVSARDTSGRCRVLRDDMPSANGITVHQGRLFVNECREGGRLFELDLAGGAPRLIAENLPSPNAMEVGPDGMLYFPVMGANQIWRIDPEGGETQVVAGDLGVPDSVKFDADGFIVSTQVHSGQVLRIDPRTGAQTVLAKLNPGLDNCTLVDGRLFVSNFTGSITEVLADGQIRDLLPGGLNWPLDLTVGADGRLYIADGTYFYALGADGTLETVAMLFTPGYPGFVRGVTAAGPGEFVVATSGGQVARYRPALGETDYLADGLDQLYGVVLDGDRILVVEQGTGRLLSVGTSTEVVTSGLDQPVDVVMGPNGPLISVGGADNPTSEAGRVVGTDGAVVVDDLVKPHGLLVRDGLLYIVDAGAKEVLSVDLTTGARQVLASGLPLGSAPGVSPKPLQGMPPFSGPQGPFAGITGGPDGTLYVSADGDGSILALRPTSGPSL
ncbi:SMP-30/gluconolactonase/LRE family protein [Mycobacterium sp. OTB74]|uniref:SMP-30/gluconolactonase/LRE family protein n=1 Tax=Mycobacterium sp. OTB74 TaxID=1853452 RepID=UPI00247554E4|nr:SMP-30/gluconolactonase/LRE family protein [Mycobacterium sp. OTB74]MDH6247922.1 sugar lactone lactonase YvrE [Mycobacterium sp. OTB74]